MRDALSLPERLLGAAVAGSLALDGGLFMMDFKTLKALPLGDRQLAALVLAMLLSLVLTGAPAGWLAAGLSGRTMLPLGTACAGAYLAPVLAWFLGFSPPWPSCWAAAWDLAFAGNWAGLGVGPLMERRKGRQGMKAGRQLLTYPTTASPALPRQRQKNTGCPGPGAGRGGPAGFFTPILP